MFDVYPRNGRVFLAVKLVLPERSNGVGVVFSHGRGGAHLFDDPHTSTGMEAQHEPD